MNVLTILGTRPEIIRLSIIMERLDQRATKHTVVHTGQNYDERLSNIFFAELNVRRPDYQLSLNSAGFGHQIGQMFTEVDDILAKEEPDAVLVLGDTNSALCALLAVRRGIPVYHMEAGNRCFDVRVPEEINRRAIDSVSTFNLPYTESSRQNLLAEGAPSNRIWVSGNPIFEVLERHKSTIDQRTILDELSLSTGQYLLATAHRAENVDQPARLVHVLNALDALASSTQLPLVLSVHPRTKSRMTALGIKVQSPLVRLCEPFGLFDFVKLEKHAKCVLTDSGTVQEECCIFQVPTVTIRESTERPETVLCGSNVVSGVDCDRIVKAAELMMYPSNGWAPPQGYLDRDVSTKVTNFIVGGLTNV